MPGIVNLMDVEYFPVSGDGTGHKVTFKTGDPIRVHVRGTRGSTVVIDTQPTTPNHEEVWTTDGI